MVYSYFPGCTLKTKAKDLDRYGRESAKALGFELEEIENWQCCGQHPDRTVRPLLRIRCQSADPVYDADSRHR